MFTAGWRGWKLNTGQYLNKEMQVKKEQGGWGEPMLLWRDFFSPWLRHFPHLFPTCLQCVEPTAPPCKAVRIRRLLWLQAWEWESHLAFDTDHLPIWLVLDAFQNTQVSSSEPTRGPLGHSVQTVPYLPPHRGAQLSGGPTSPIPNPSCHILILPLPAQVNILAFQICCCWQLDMGSRWQHSPHSGLIQFLARHCGHCKCNF